MLTYEAIDGWFNFADLYDAMVAEAGDNAEFVEIGCWFGRSAVYLGTAIKNSGKRIRLHCVDTWQGSPSDDELQQMVAGTEMVRDQYGGSIASVFWKNIEDAGVASYVTQHVMPSLDGAKRFRDESLDFVFIDADHHEQACRDDIKAWLPKVKPGGVLAGHDYNWPSVKAAVDAMLPDARPTSDASWIWRKPKGVTFAIGMITAPRPVSTIQSTIDSLRAAGFTEPLHVFPEPGMEPIPGVEWHGMDGPPFGIIANAARSLRWLLEYTDSTHLLLLQDDVMLSSRARQSLFAVLKGVAGFASLYTPEIYADALSGKAGWVEYNRGFPSCTGQANCVPRDQARVLATDPRWDSMAPGSYILDGGYGADDTIIACHFEERRVPCYYHVPSLADHVGTSSSREVRSIIPRLAAQEVLVGQPQPVPQRDGRSPPQREHAG